MTNSGLIYEGFLRSAGKFPQRPALEVTNRVVSYSDLRQRAFQLAATLQKYELCDQPLLTAVFGYRSVTTFAGILAALLRGHGYVPLNRTFPPERTKLMLERSECRALVVDELSAAQLPRVLEGLSNKLLILMPDEPDPHEFAARWPQHEIIGSMASRMQTASLRSQVHQMISPMFSLRPAAQERPKASWLVTPTSGAI